MAYAFNRRIYVRALDQLDAVPIAGTEGADGRFGFAPFFSADGKWIGFFQEGRLKRYRPAAAQW
jgi:serine/threonine-protein kinase